MDSCIQRVVPWQPICDVDALRHGIRAVRALGAQARTFSMQHNGAGRHLLTNTCDDLLNSLAEQRQHARSKQRMSKIMVEAKQDMVGKLKQADAVMFDSTITAIKEISFPFGMHRRRRRTFTHGTTPSASYQSRHFSRCWTGTCSHFKCGTQL